MAVPSSFEASCSTFSEGVSTFSEGVSTFHKKGSTFEYYVSTFNIILANKSSTSYFRCKLFETIEKDRIPAQL